MEIFKKLLDITNHLHSSEGCPWDREQTFESLKPYILEEAYEVLEAIDTDKDDKIIEELGDLFYTVIFYAKLAEKDRRFSLQNILEELCAKLIRRHPHVFGQEKAHSVDEVIHHWERIKKNEREKNREESVLDSIPKTLPSLARAQKLVKRMQKSHYSAKVETDKSIDLPHAVLNLIYQAVEADINLEEAFRSLLAKEEERFRLWEKELREKNDSFSSK